MIIVATATKRERCMNKNNHVSIGKLIDIINRNIKQIISHEISDDCIGPGQFHFLHIISRNEGIPQKELVEMMKINKANVTRGIIRLEKNGYIKRVRNEDDNRVINLFLTDRGSSIIPELKKAKIRITEICTEKLTEKETETLFILLEKVKDSVTSETERIKGSIDINEER